MLTGPKAASQELKAVAFHEAGHVVVGTRLGLTVLDSDIDGDDDGGHGHTHFAAVDRRDREVVGRVVTTFMAGSAAEVKLGFTSEDGSGFDFDAALREWLGYLEPNPARRPALARTHFAIAEAELEQPGVWDSVQAVAAALLSRRRLDGSEARSLVRV